MDRSILNIAVCNINRHVLWWFILHNHTTLRKFSQTYSVIQALKLDYTLYEVSEKCTTVMHVILQLTLTGKT